MTKLNRYLTIIALAALVVLTACSDDATSPVNGEVVTDSYPLALGNHWEYTLDQSVYVEREGEEDISVSAGGSQSVTVTRTENVGGDESFAMTYTHIVDYLFSVGTDTVVEHRYFAPTSDGRILLKAEEIIYNPGNNFIPFGDGNSEPVYGTLIEVDGKQEFISLETLGYLLSDPRGTFFDNRRNGTSLASDGLLNNENAFVYADDRVYMYKDLYEGLKWVSQDAQQADDIEISGRVTAVLDEVDGYQGPIAVVEELNSLTAGALGIGEQFVQRFYYKGGVGLIRAEISDPDFLIIVQNNDGSAELGIGTWTFTKTLDSHSIQ